MLLVINIGELQVSEKERGALFDSMLRDVAAVVVDKSINPDNNRPYTVSNEIFLIRVINH